MRILNHEAKNYFKIIFNDSFPILQKTFSTSVIKTLRLKTFRERIAIYCYKKPTSKYIMWTELFLMLKLI